MHNAIAAAFGIVTTLFSLVGFCAVGDGLAHWLGISYLLSYPLALFVAAFPLIGGVLAYLSAVHVWHLAWYWAALIVYPFWLYPIAIIAGVMGASVLGIMARLFGRATKQP